MGSNDGDRSDLALGCGARATRGPAPSGFDPPVLLPAGRKKVKIKASKFLVYSKIIIIIVCSTGPEIRSFCSKNSSQNFLKTCLEIAPFVLKIVVKNLRHALKSLHLF